MTIAVLITTLLPCYTQKQRVTFVTLFAYIGKGTLQMFVTVTLF